MADAKAPNVRAHRPGPTPPVARLGVTIAVAGIVVSLAQVPLAGLRALAGAGGHEAPASILALGLTPIIAAFVVVELAALLLPAWRPLRLSGYPGRRQLGRLALLLAIPLTAVQTAGSVRALVTLGRLAPHVGPVVLVAATLAAGPFFLLLLAGIVSRFGLGEGFSVILGSLIVAEGVPVAKGVAARFGAGRISSQDLLFVVGVEVVIALDTLWTLHRKVRRPAPDGDVVLPLPASGIVPLQILGWVVALVPSVALFVPALEPVAARLMAVGHPAQIALLGVVVVLGALLAWAFNRPVLVGRFLARSRGLPEQAPEMIAIARRLLVEGGAHTLVFLVLLEVAFFFAGGLAPAVGLLGAVWVVVLVAVVVDVRADWRFRTEHGSAAAVWPLQRVYAVAPVLEAMDTAGIPALPRGAAHRTLLQVVGPYVPMTILVPEPLASDAVEVMELVLSGGGTTVPP